MMWWCVWLLEQVFKTLGFEGSESLLAVLCKNFRNGLPGLFLDTVVGVDELVTESFVELAANGGFATAHESNEYNVTHWRI